MFLTLWLCSNLQSNSEKFDFEKNLNIFVFRDKGSSQRVYSMTVRCFFRPDKTILVTVQASLKAAFVRSSLLLLHLSRTKLAVAYRPASSTLSRLPWSSISCSNDDIRFSDVHVGKHHMQKACPCCGDGRRSNSWRTLDSEATASRTSYMSTTWTGSVQASPSQVKKLVQGDHCTGSRFLAGSMIVRIIGAPPPIRSPVDYCSEQRFHASRSEEETEHRRRERMEVAREGQNACKSRESGAAVPGGARNADAHQQWPIERELAGGSERPARGTQEGEFLRPFELLAWFRRAASSDRFRFILHLAGGSC
jgi:hypothetical protein